MLKKWRVLSILASFSMVSITINTLSLSSKKVYIGTLSSELIVFKSLARKILGIQSKLVTIDGVTKTLTKSTSCKPKNWKNNQENSCRCCIIKHTHELKGNAQNATQNANRIIEHCISKKHCSSEIINLIKLKKSLEDKSTQEFIQSIYDQAIVIPQLDYKDGLIDEHGKFTEDTILSFLVQAYKAGKLPSHDFKDVTCLTGKNLVDLGGSKALQLFLINSACTENEETYIVKEMLKEELEPKNLERLKDHPEIQQLITPLKSEGFSGIVLPIAYLPYKSKDKEHYLVIIHISEGAALLNLLLEYKSDPSFFV